MAYASHTSHIYRPQRAPKSSLAALLSLDFGACIRIGIVFVAFLCVLYVSETNALMFLERTMPAKERTVREVKNDVNALEIRAAELAASQTVKEAAISHAMIAPREVSYVAAGDSAVALGPSVR